MSAERRRRYRRCDALLIRSCGTSFSESSSVDDVTKQIKSLELGLRERRDDLDALSRRIDSLTLQKTQSRSNRARPLPGLSGEDEPVKLVSEAMNAELDGDLLLRAVKANRSELSMVPRSAGKEVEAPKEGEAPSKGKFIGGKVELRRPRTMKPERVQEVSTLVVPPTSTPRAGSSSMTERSGPTASLFARFSPGPTPGSSKPTFSLPSANHQSTLSTSPSTVPLQPMQGFDFGLTPSTSGLNSRAGYRPMNKHQREKVEAGSAGKKAAVPVHAGGLAGGGGTAGTTGAGFG